jgi:hypothetical protein
VKAAGASIFLAGPTPRDANVLSWRPGAIEHLSQMGFGGKVFVPEPKSGEWLNEYTHNFFWERTKMLSDADTVLFWIPRCEYLPGFTTNVEFGVISERKPLAIAYGRPDDAPHTRYLDELYFAKTGRLPHSSLEKTVRYAVRLAEHRSVM